MSAHLATFVKGIRGTDEILTDGVPQLCFVGRSNVGKSSLLNTLTGVKGLAHEGDKPGKTQEINFYHVDRKYYFVDLPGYGFAQVSKTERDKLRNLIVWYLTESKARIVTVALVIEAVAGVTEFDRGMYAILTKENIPHVIVINKVDKLTQKELSDRMKEIHEGMSTEQVFFCSTRTGGGIEELRNELFARAVSATS